jgi:hypothetical protein
MLSLCHGLCVRQATDASGEGFGHESDAISAYDSSDMANFDSMWNHPIDPEMEIPMSAYPVAV